MMARRLMSGFLLPRKPMAGAMGAKRGRKDAVKRPPGLT